MSSPKAPNLLQLKISNALPQGTTEHSSPLAHQLPRNPLFHLHPLLHLGLRYRSRAGSLVQTPHRNPGLQSLPIPLPLAALGIMDSRNQIIYRPHMLAFIRLLSFLKVVAISLPLSKPPVGF